MNNLIELSEKQKQIVFYKDSAMYVQASAGSGKTRVLTERIRFCLENTQKKVLALTFTNKAGEEIRERLSDIEKLDNRVFIGTFHGFCQSVLENHGSFIGLSTLPHIFEDESDRLELIEQAISQTPTYFSGYQAQSTDEKRKFRYQVLDYISKVKREILDENDLADRTDNEDIVLLYRNYQDILRSQNAIDFDDIILQACKLFMNFPKVAGLYRRSFHSICIDEAQDLNNAQYQIIKHLTNGEFFNILMVGDPNQSIYHFNGSSPKYMNEAFVNDFKPEIVLLNENYRSSLQVLMAANQIINVDDDFSTLVVNGEYQLSAYEDEFTEAQGVIGRIQTLIQQKKHKDIEGDITYEKIAILARNKYVFSHLEKKLQTNQIPYYYKMGQGTIKFESDKMKIFDLALRIKLNENDELHLGRLLSKLKLHDHESIKSLQDLNNQTLNKVDSEVIELVLKLSEDGSNLKALVKSFKESVTLDDDNDLSMLIKDLDELLEHWVTYAKSNDRKSLHKFKNAMALGQTQPNQDHKGVTLSTVHTMKGQEFDIVFVIGLDDDTFPDYRAIRSGGVDLKQEKNNLYVAYTRAKRLLYASYPKQRTMPWGKVAFRNLSRFLRKTN
ncbi:ATP-dependent helicase [Pseudoalteromonas sp. SG43-7]|uniref:ATP-dependent helicase n=1 Tax=Pseudoalteromonas sp. SG43-7 TaxID=2760966 RepID=UPI0016015663|nr:ATP-dependent helicase [Pseudoalteromonas sp. SG43-7]MBB1424601.1 ATP-dependent helicase [Pseudoalteromonas sp. SG43-7]